MNRFLNFPVLLAGITFLAFSCRTTVETPAITTLQQISIGDDKKIEANISDLIEIKSIKLLAGDNAKLFHNPGKVYRHESKYYISGKLTDGAILVTDENFQEIACLNKAGKDYDQYIDLSDFTLDAENEQLVIYNFDTQRLYFYDLLGNFIRSETIGYYATSMEYHDGQLYLGTAKHQNIYNGQEYNADILILDPESDSVRQSFKSFDPNHFSGVRIHNSKPFFYKGDQLYYQEALDDTTFLLSDGQLIPQYAFHYQNQTLPPSILKEGHEKLIKTLQFNSGEVGQLTYLPTVNNLSERYLFYKYVHRSKLIFGFYDQQKAKNHEFTGLDFQQNTSILNPLTNDSEGNFTAIIPFYLLSKLQTNDPELTENTQMDLPYDPDEEQLVAVTYQIK